ncbi:MAG: pentapeptide repeat-containing protein [Epulopiscium sp.]|nr:pentapeptide repeat-containing protein [Candidatus Epulonipiscium sp.]
MSRGKNKRENKQRQKKVKKIKQGQLVPFDLQNSPIKYTGFKNRYFYKANIHNLIYVQAKFENVRYQASNITKCNFKNAKLRGVDFCNSNLKATSFKGATLEDVIFMNCNLKDVDFRKTRFRNVYFIMTNMDVCKNIILDTNCKILKHYPTGSYINDIGKKALYNLGKDKEIYKYHVLHVMPNKVNMWVLGILFNEYGDGVNRALSALDKRKQKRYFYTIASYMRFIESYLKL